MSLSQVLELPDDGIITICAWCGYKINKHGIRSKVKYDKGERDGLSNGICLVCSVKYFR